MMSREPYVSLCIPTNGVMEWVVPVLDSIYAEKCDTDNFEVVVTDNGQNFDFQNAMEEYQNRYSNLIYKKTDAQLFQNQVEAFKLARGQLIKFVNHRMTLLSGTVEYLIAFVKKYTETKPMAYFSNGMLNLHDKVKECSSFDEYVRTLSYWSSWSAGTAIWKSHFEQMNLDQPFNGYFPHTDIVFFEKSGDKYIVDDTVLMQEIPADVTKKGSYDLFDAFAVQYPTIIQQLYVERAVTKKTYEFIKRKNGFFVSDLYLQYMIKKRPCSYNLDGYDQAVGKYYGNIEIKVKAVLLEIKYILKKIVRGK
ncbi:MAG TPA: hypothetical protein DHV96_06820 [Lachnospiraceae bacterium]|nr:hypothetical protein [Lachnospiraceae bacterium]